MRRLKTPLSEYKTTALVATLIYPSLQLLLLYVSGGVIV